MAASSVHYEAELRRQFAQGGPVILKAATPGDTLLANLVSQLIRDYSKRSGNASDFDSLYLEDFQLVGNLDLNNRGLEGAPQSVWSCLIATSPVIFLWNTGS